MTRTPASGTPGVTREFVGLDSPTARRAGSGGHPVPGAVPPRGGPQAEGGDDRHPLSDRLLRALSRRLHGHPRHRLPRLEHPVPRLREQFPARPRPGRHRRRRPLAARGPGRGNHCAAGQLRWRFADGGLPGTGRRPPRDTAGGHAARGRAHRPARRRRLRGQRRAPRPSRMSSPRGWMRRSSTKTTPIATDPDLDLFDEKQRPALLRGLHRAATASAQVARNNAITDWAETRAQAGSRGGLLRPPVHRAAHLGRPADGRPRRWSRPSARPTCATPASRSRPTGRRTASPRPARCAAGSACGACGTRRPAPNRIWPASTAPRWSSTPNRTPASTPPTPSASTTRWPAPTSRSARSTPTTTSPPRGAQREGRYDRQVDREAVALRVLAHFVPGDKVLEFRCARDRIGSISATAPRTTTTPSTASCPRPR